MRANLRRHAWVLVLLALCACAAPPALAPEPATTLVWPSAPAPAKIAFVRAFSRPEDLGIGKGFWQRLVDFVFGQTEARLIRPTAVLEADGVVYVADPGAKGVHRFDRAAGSYALIRGEGGLDLPSPVGLAWGGDGSAYVTDSALAAVFVIKPGAEAAIPVPLAQGLAQPTGIAVDPAMHRLYVVDTARHRVNVYASDGSLHSSFGRRGSGDGEFNFPTLIWREATGRILLTDSLNFRTQILDAQGRFLGGFGRAGDGAGDSPRQKGVASDRHGHVYAVDSLLQALQVFDASGQLLLSIGGLGHAPGDFWLPTGIFVGADDMIYVADSYNQRVQVFRYVGGPI